MLYWTTETFNEVKSAMPEWMGALMLRVGVPSRLSPADVKRAIERFAERDYGEGHPEGIDLPGDETKGEAIFAQYRASDHVPNEPFYLRWTPRNYYREKYPEMAQGDEEEPAHLEVLTWSDY